MTQVSQNFEEQCIYLFYAIPLLALIPSTPPWRLHPPSNMEVVVLFGVSASCREPGYSITVRKPLRVGLLEPET